MLSNSKTGQSSARVSVRVPQPESLVEVRVTPPDSGLQVEVSSGGEVIELLVRPGAGLIEVRVTPPGEDLPESERAQFRHFNAGRRPEAETEASPGADRAELAGPGEGEEPGEVKKLPDPMAGDGEEGPIQIVFSGRLTGEARNIAEPVIMAGDERNCLAEGCPEDKPVEFELPFAAEPGNDESVQAVRTEGRPDEMVQPEAMEPAQPSAQAASAESGPDNTGFAPARAVGTSERVSPVTDGFLSQLALENGAVWGPGLPIPATAKWSGLSGPAASRTLEQMPAASNGYSVKEYDYIAPEVIDAAALGALVRLNQAVREERLAIEKAFLPVEKPKPGEATVAADGFIDADCTIMVEIYDEVEPESNPAEAVAPLPEDEIMDLGQLEKEAELAVGFIYANDPGPFSPVEVQLVESGDDPNMVKARPMARVIPNNTMVPE